MSTGSCGCGPALYPGIEANVCRRASFHRRSWRLCGPSKPSWRDWRASTPSFPAPTVPSGCSSPSRTVRPWRACCCLGTARAPRRRADAPSDASSAAATDRWRQMRSALDHCPGLPRAPAPAGTQGWCSCQDDPRQARGRSRLDLPSTHAKPLRGLANSQHRSTTA